MTIREIEAIALRIGFRETFRVGTTDRTSSPNVVLRVTTADGIVGYGEACPVPAFTGETQESIVALVEQRVKPLQTGERLDGPARITYRSGQAGLGGCVLVQPPLSASPPR